MIKGFRKKRKSEVEDNETFPPTCLAVVYTIGVSTAHVGGVYSHDDVPWCQPLCSDEGCLTICRAYVLLLFSYGIQYLEEVGLHHSREVTILLLEFLDLVLGVIQSFLDFS